VLSTNSALLFCDSWLPFDRLAVHQGVGYLEDGTMVVVENGRGLLDQTISVRATRLISRPTGQMIFAVPDDSKH